MPTPHPSNKLALRHQQVFCSKWGVYPHLCFETNLMHINDGISLMYSYLSICTSSSYVAFFPHFVLFHMLLLCSLWNGSINNLFQLLSFFCCQDNFSAFFLFLIFHIFSCILNHVLQRSGYIRIATNHFKDTDIWIPISLTIFGHVLRKSPVQCPYFSTRTAQDIFN